MDEVYSSEDAYQQLLNEQKKKREEIARLKAMRRQMRVTEKKDVAGSTG